MKRVNVSNNYVVTNDHFLLKLLHSYKQLFVTLPLESGANRLFTFKGLSNNNIVSLKFVCKKLIRMFSIEQ